MGEPAEFVNLKLSNGNSVTSHRSNTNGRHHASNGHQSENGVSTMVHQNGFISNKAYGDFDTARIPFIPPKGTAVSDVSSPTPGHEDTTPATIPPRQPASRTSRPSSAKPAEKFIPEHEIEIPADGSLHEFTADDMSTFLRYLGVEERIVTHVHKKSLDGAKFSKLKDADLETLSMKNPIICHFRDRSMKAKSGSSKRKSLPFML